jgi:hypothetical protein
MIILGGSYYIDELQEKLRPVLGDDLFNFFYQKITSLL